VNKKILLAVVTVATVAAARDVVPSPSYALKNWGLFTDKYVSHIDAVSAWRYEEGSRKTIVAVIDTGIDATHKNLADNLWHDSSNDAYGWDFVTNHSNPSDNHGHGTHIAGIIGAVFDPRNGVSGVAHHVSIMSVKYYSDSNSGSVNLRNTVKAIDYAVQHGATIINYSGGGPEFSEEEYLALKKAEAKGILFVAAAGNEHQNIDLVENYYYPSAYRLSNIISVASIDIKSNLLPSSNWGKTRVDVAAPGENIHSTLPGGKYGYMTGTSQATAFVTGIAALLKSCNPRLKPTQIKSIIFNSVDHVPALKDKVATSGHVNAYKALQLARSQGLCRK
jgi:subtilisin family serine protease